MPKWRLKSDSSGGGGGRGGGGGGSEEKESRQRSKTVLGVFRTRLRRNRSSSESDCGTLSSKAKSTTLPARMEALDKKGKPKTLYWMGEMVDAIDSIEVATVTRKESEESVDSGFEQFARAEGSETDSSNSPGQSKALELVPQAEPNLYEAPGLGGNMYDSEAVERAFGPMKDVGRWYSKVHRQQSVRAGREGVDEEDERLASRPLPPIPLEARTLRKGEAGESDEEEGEPAYENETQAVYEHIEYRMIGGNGLILGLRNLSCNGWYWGPITRVEAEEKLAGLNDGSFLVRDSSDDRYLLSLSFRSQRKTLHTRIEYSNGFFSFYSFPDSESEGYQSVVKLIEKSMEYSRDGVFCFSRARALGSPAVPVRLLKPLSRFSQVRSLQHYCRFVIRQSIRFDRIQHLPLPKHVHGYLKQSQF